MPKQYQSLNDAVVSGLTEIWYAKLSQHVDFNGKQESICHAAYNGWTPDIKQLHLTHVLIGKIQATELETIFAIMQGECWSPNGEANELIRRLGADHTSMSIGDVIKIVGEVWICRPFGFEQISS